MKTTEITCVYCGTKAHKCTSEIKRQRAKGRSNFFCSRHCSELHHSENFRIDTVIKDCPVCGKKFNARTRKNGWTFTATFCSRSCASKGSVTHYRRKMARETGLQSVEKLSKQEKLRRVAKGLRKREWYKYRSVHDVLNSLGFKHYFEHVISDYVCDLYIPSKLLVIEFDGPYHNGETKKQDIKRDNNLNELGYTVARVPDKNRAKHVLDVIKST
jgi:very-short-patch-repair endonuclease